MPLDRIRIIGDGALPPVPDQARLESAIKEFGQQLDAADSDTQNFYIYFLGMLKVFTHNAGALLDTIKKFRPAEDAFLLEALSKNSDIQVSPYSFLGVNQLFVWFEQRVKDIYGDFRMQVIHARIGQGATQSAAVLLDAFLEGVEQRLDHISLEASQWNIVTIINLLQWFDLMLDKQYWRGDPPFFMYIDSENMPAPLPRFYNQQDWATGFGGRLIVPNLAGLSAEQKKELWNFLLVEKGIYDNENIRHGVRGEVFQLMTDFLQDVKTDSGQIVHLDVCGGRGDFLKYLQEQDFEPKVDSQLVDIASEAVAMAQGQGFQAVEANVDEGIPSQENSIDLITIIFAIQWLQPTAMEHIFKVLRSGGKVVFNAYPPELEMAQHYSELLTEAGFGNVQIQVKDSSVTGYTHYLLVAEKPEV